MLIGKARMCLALPHRRKGDSLAHVDMEERQHVYTDSTFGYMNVWEPPWLGNQGNGGEFKVLF